MEHRYLCDAVPAVLLNSRFFINCSSSWKGRPFDLVFKWRVNACLSYLVFLRQEVLPEFLKSMLIIFIHALLSYNYVLSFIILADDVSHLDPSFYYGSLSFWDELYISWSRWFSKVKVIRLLIKQELVCIVLDIVEGKSWCKNCEWMIRVQELRLYHIK